MTDPRPSLGLLADTLYAKLRPYQTFTLDGVPTTDADLGWPLLIFYGLIMKRFQPVDDLSRDSDYGPGWSILFDPDEIPDEGLDWQSQTVGVVFPPGLSPVDKRARNKYTGMKNRCTPSAIAVNAARHLVAVEGPVPTVIINERLGGDANQIGVITWTSETPDPELTRLDIEEQLPWWIQLTHTVEDAWDYATLRTAFDDYGAVRAHYASTGYLGIREDDPPA